MSKRTNHEPAYVLHRYDWSESSLILEIFTRHQGRIAMVAKGVKRPNSQFRPVLLPLQPLQLNFTSTTAADGSEAEVRTLKGAEWMGGHVMPTGDALLSGYYINELLMRLLARDDPYPQLFDVYTSVVQIIASEHGEVLQATLRSFELLLLQAVGLLPALDMQTMTREPLIPDSRYSLVPEGGLRQASPHERASLSGTQWQTLHLAVTDNAPFTTTLRACAPITTELKPQLRTLLHDHCGVGTLRTRQMMVELQNLKLNLPALPSI